MDLTEITHTVHHALEQTIIAISGKAAWFGGAVAAGSGVVHKTVDGISNSPDVAERMLALSDLGIICGMTVGIVGVTSKVIFEIRADRRAERIARAQIGDK